MWSSATEWLTHLAAFMVLCTIIAGGLVHATGSGLACPDWPLCFGQYFPTMEGAVLYEHSHRLIAGFTGVVVWLAGIAGMFDERTSRSESYLFGGSMVLIVVQAVFGGLTVLWNLPDWVSTTHFILAQGTLAVMVTLSWRMWRTRRRPREDSTTRFFREGHRWIGGVSLFLVATQLVVGAWLRHIGSPGAPPDVTCEAYPLCAAKWVQTTTSYYYLYYVWHRILAVIVTVSVVSMAWLYRDFKNRLELLYNLGLIASLTVLVQIFIGVLTVRTYFSVIPATLHLAGADLLFIALLVINLELWSSDDVVSSPTS